MTQTLIYVALGGAFGSMLRFILGYSLAHYKVFKVASGTLVVNLIGSFLIGLLISTTVKNAQHENVRFFLITGVLGGFTTFSAFSLENMHLLKDAEYKYLLLNIMVQTFGGLLLAFAGYALGKSLN